MGNKAEQQQISETAAPAKESEWSKLFLWAGFALYFLSGFAAIVYQLVWIRALSEIIGATSLAVSTMFSMFLFGLALGYGVVSLRQPSEKASLWVFAILELFIGSYALLTTPWFFKNAIWLANFVPSLHEAAALKVIGAYALVSLLLMGLPVIAMGMTLVIFVRGLRFYLPAVREDVTLGLYAYNTLGSAFAAIVTGFVLIPEFGLHKTLLTAASGNVIAALGAITLWLILKNRKWQTAPVPAEQTQLQPDIVAIAAMPALSPGRALIFSFFSGFLIMSTEVNWERLAKFSFGNRTQASSLLLFCILLSLAAASFFIKAQKEKVKKNAPLLLGNLFLAGAWLGPILAAAVCHSISANLLGEMSFLLLLAISALALLLNLVIGGMVFPTLLELQASDRLAGLPLAKLLFANTFGCMVGGFWTGFFSLTTIGFAGNIVLVSALFLALVLLLDQQTRQFLRKHAFFTAVMAIVLLFLAPPADWYCEKNTRIIEAVEDEYGFSHLFEDANGAFCVRTNRTYLIAPLGFKITSWSQQIPAHWSVLLCPTPKRALVIGNGFGITAGTFALYDEVADVKTIEIIPFLLKTLERFGDYNFHYFNDKRFKTILGDGKTILLNAPDGSFDILNVNITDPSMENSSSFYTEEFYRMVWEKLADNGCFSLLLHPDSALPIYKTLRLIFPNALLFPAYSNSYVVVCQKSSAANWQPKLFSARISSNPRLGKELAKFGINASGDYFTKTLEFAIKKAQEWDKLILNPAIPINTMDYPAIEFSQPARARLQDLLQSYMAVP